MAAQSECCRDRASHIPYRPDIESGMVSPCILQTRNLRSLYGEETYGEDPRRPSTFKPPGTHRSLLNAGVNVRLTASQVGLGQFQLVRLISTGKCSILSLDTVILALTLSEICPRWHSSQVWCGLLCSQNCSHSCRRVAYPHVKDDGDGDVGIVWGPCVDNGVVLLQDDDADQGTSAAEPQLGTVLELPIVQDCNRLLLGGESTPQPHGDLHNPLDCWQPKHKLQQKLMSLRCMK